MVSACHSPLYVETHLYFHLSIHRFPNIKGFVDEVVESKEGWLRRRLELIAKDKRKFGERMTVADVKKNMGLKPNTYRKYGTYIETLIKQLNKD